MHLRCKGWEIFRVYDYSSRNRSKSCQISAIERLKATEQSKGGAEVDRDDSCIKSIWVEVSRQMPPLLSVVEEMEGVAMDGGM